MTSLLVTETSKEEYLSLEQVPCIYYLLRFWKDITGVRALFDLGSEVNAMTPAYAIKLGLKIWKTDIRGQKIHGSILDTFGTVLADF